MLESLLSLSFLDIYSLSSSYLECKALCMLMSFHVLSFFCCFSWFGSYISFVICCFFGLHFQHDTFYMLISTSVSSLYILTACNRASITFSFLIHNLMSSMNIRWSIVSCNSWSLYPPVHFLSIWRWVATWLIINSNSDSASPWNISYYIFTLVKRFPHAVISTLQVFHFIFDNLYDFPGHLAHYPVLWYYIIVVVKQAIANFFRLVWLYLRMCCSMYSSFPVPLVHLRHPFCSSGNNLRLVSKSKISQICAVNIFPIIGRHVKDLELLGAVLLRVFFD